MKPLLKRLIAAASLFAAFAAGAQAGDITLYTHDNFGGPALSVHGPTPDLARLGFNDRTSSVIVRSGVWELCEHANYDGHCIVVEPGEYRKLEGFNDQISSLREIDRAGGHPGGPGGPGGWRGGDRGDRGDDHGPDRGRPHGAPVSLFSQRGFGGARVDVQNEVRTLVNVDFNDQASSVIINDGRWELCDDADFRGKCIVLGEGRYDDLRDMNNRISSLRRVR